LLVQHEFLGGELSQGGKFLRSKYPVGASFSSSACFSASMFKARLQYCIRVRAGDRLRLGEVSFAAAA